jgi:hypothetical protein
LGASEIPFEARDDLADDDVMVGTDPLRVELVVELLSEPVEGICVTKSDEAVEGATRLPVVQLIFDVTEEGVAGVAIGVERLRLLDRAGIAGAEPAAGAYVV